MKQTGTKILLIFILASIIIFQGCGGDETTAPDPVTVVNIFVKSSADSISINGANIVLYNADNGEAVWRILSSADGLARFEGSISGNFYVRISAQGYHELPLGSVTPVPFSVTSGETFSQTYYMNPMAGTFGRIDGAVTPKVPGFLIVAKSSSGSSEYHSYSGPEGYFVLYNIPYGTYTVDAVKSGYKLNVQPELTLSSSSASATLQLILNQINGSGLSGKVTFLSAVNGIVDVSLREKTSLSVISGLTTRIDSNRNYAINNIPDGDYVAWASYENDGYVMDPDWLFKNPGALEISFAGSPRTLDFSVTDAVTIVSPTNPSQAVVPMSVDSLFPSFEWDSYPQAKEYIIEVRDINGNLIWGGFTETGEINHAQIPKEWNNVRFNFDGSAAIGLNRGEIYQWRVFADDDAAPGVQTLLSSSEDLMGLFIIKPE